MIVSIIIAIIISMFVITCIIIIIITLDTIANVFVSFFLTVLVLLLNELKRVLWAHWPKGPKRSQRILSRSHRTPKGPWSKSATNAALFGLWRGPMGFCMVGVSKRS